MEIYLVGGAVRDKLLGLPVTERDWVVVGATPDAMLELGYQPVGREFPVFLHPKTKEEYALARTERKTGPVKLLQLRLPISQLPRLGSFCTTPRTCITTMWKERDFLDPKHERANYSRQIAQAWASSPILILSVILWLFTNK